MRIVILGAGVVGVATAWHCLRAGHEVVVVDRQPGAGLETSFANAGQLSYGFAAPWAAPGLPWKALRWLAMKHRPLVLWPRPDPAMIGWPLRLLANCTPEAFARNRDRMLRLALYSKRAMASLRQETGIAYDGQSRGTLQLFRRPEQMEAARARGPRPRCPRAWSTGCSTPRAASPANPPSLWCVRVSPAGCSCPGTRRETRICSPSAWRRWRNSKGRCSATARW